MIQLSLIHTHIKCPSILYCVGYRKLTMNQPTKCKPGAEKLFQNAYCRLRYEIQPLMKKGQSVLNFSNLIESFVQINTVPPRSMRILKKIAIKNMHSFFAGYFRNKLRQHNLYKSVEVDIKFLVKSALIFPKFEDSTSIPGKMQENNGQNFII